MRKESIIEIFRSLNAILEGHFLLSSGLHSDKYVQCALVLQYPDIAEKIAILLFEEIRNNSEFWGDINVVVSPALGGIVIGQELARVVRTLTGQKVRSIFTERDDKGIMTLRRGFSLSNSDNVLIVEDVITTGKSTREVIDVVKSRGAKVLAVSSILNRTDKNLEFGFPYFFLTKILVNNFLPENCPLCKENLPFIKPGSRKL
ncbi:MAG: orotate phosphoribosyltransferase [Endomicrobia bacterium]|nr:orotate phosphoribosyltransferase [Endomicrobiia bacterium]